MPRTPAPPHPDGEVGPMVDDSKPNGDAQAEIARMLTAMIGDKREDNPPLAEVRGVGLHYDVYANLTGDGEVVILTQPSTGFYTKDGEQIGGFLRYQTAATLGEALRTIAQWSDEEDRVHNNG